jgi:putative hydroxymethylpyrimidine transport system substrate-binding protein
MTTLKIALEWFLNPDHLPMIVGIKTGKYKEAGLDVQLLAPDEHYDGFEQLKNKEIDIHCNEPLHLYEHYFDGLKSLGCFFETDGGVMIKEASIEKLRTNKPIKITTPASNEVTNTIGFEILKRYAGQEGFTLDKENVEFVQTDFYHIKNMKEGDYDGAWLCFYNFEGVEAEFDNFPNLFIDAHLSPYPNFSALEFMTTDEVISSKKGAIDRFINITSEMAEYCKENIQQTKEFYYEYSDENPSELMDKIIENTIPRFDKRIEANSTRWLELYKFLEELKIVELDYKQYKNIWYAQYSMK